MSSSALILTPPIEYPEPDGAPMAESDPARKYLNYSVEALSIYFAEQSEVYVSGNLWLSYQEGEPKATVAPDVLVIRGVEKKERKSYRVWEEGGKVPEFILEITSKKTRKVDEEDKPKIYRKMGVKEYWQYDPTGDYLKPPLKGKRLNKGKYQILPLEVLEDGTLVMYSETLGLELRVIPQEGLRFVERETGRRLLNHQETELARQQAELQRQQAELERQQEAIARQQAQREREAEAIARQQAELARQQAQRENQRLQQELEAEIKAKRKAIEQFLALGLTIPQIAQAWGITPEEVDNFRQS